MRQLKPHVVEKRKKDLLQWIVHYFIKNSRPVASAVIAKEAGMELSSATIRNILHELEEEGFLHQAHSSSGREPTDKGYRFFVDYLTGIQRLASEEKATIERQYKNRMAELDTLLTETSKLLSKVSHGAGLVLSTGMRQAVVKRLEIIPLGGSSVLAILVTETGLVRHWPIKLSFSPTARRLEMLNRFLNDSVPGCCVHEAQKVVTEKLREVESEFREMSALAADLLREVSQVVVPESLYIEGADNILGELGEVKEMQSLMRLLSEKRALAGLLELELKRENEEAEAGTLPGVRIGGESGVPELASMSLVTKTYRYKNHPVGVLGILGSKRMEYPRMMALVSYMSDVVTRELHTWEEEVS